LTTYNTNIYDISKVILPKIEPHSSYNVIEINKDKLELVMQFIKENKKLFQCLVLPDITNIASMIETGKLLIYGVVFSNEIICLYFFINNEVYYDGKKSIDLIGSINTNKQNNELFINYFYNVVSKIKEKIKNEIIIIENISHNNYLINSFVQKNIKLLFNSPCAYFLYNYACYSIENNKCFILS
jgi:hypothetical protein